MPELVLLCCDVELSALPAPCCGLPEAAVEVVPPLLAPSAPLALLVLLTSLPLLFVLLDAWVFDCDAACVFAGDDCAGDGGGADACGGVLCSAVLGLCAASFCESMLCCKVCANGCVLALFVSEIVGVVPDESASELTNDMGDIADPVYPVSPVKFRSAPVKRLCAQAPAGAGHVVMQARGLHTLGAHPENSCGMFVGVALLAPRHLLGFRRIAACLQYFVRA